MIMMSFAIFPLNFDTPWLTFSRLRPLHTNAVIFAFGGSALMATSLYVVQRTCQTPLFSKGLAQFVFWGQSKEYAELEWPIDILIAVVWVAYGVLFFGTVAKRKTSHIYVANWFYGAFIITVAVLHIVNSMVIPYSYKLSIVHFWALIATYMWAGPHHLHYTALPDWTQSLGMVLSLILLAPSWGQRLVSLH